MGKRKDREGRAIQKTITIFPEHEKFILAESLSLSSFVQKALDEKMNDTTKHKKQHGSIDLLSLH